MNEERLHTHTAALESEQKFDYWIATLTGAVFAYVVKEHVPRNLDSLPAILEVLSLTLIAASFWFSYKRIEYMSEHTQLNHKLWEGANAVKVAREGLQDSRSTFVEDLTGDVRTRKEVEESIPILRKTNKDIQSQMRVAEANRETTGRRRFQLLIWGLLALTASKMIPPCNHGGTPADRPAVVTNQPPPSN